MFTNQFSLLSNQNTPLVLPPNGYISDNDGDCVIHYVVSYERVPMLWPYEIDPRIRIDMLVVLVVYVNLVVNI